MRVQTRILRTTSTRQQRLLKLEELPTKNPTLTKKSVKTELKRQTSGWAMIKHIAKSSQQLSASDIVDIEKRRIQDRTLFTFEFISEYLKLRVFATCKHKATCFYVEFPCSYTWFHVKHVYKHRNSTCFYV